MKLSNAQADYLKKAVEIEYRKLDLERETWDFSADKACQALYKIINQCTEDGEEPSQEHPSDWFRRMDKRMDYLEKRISRIENKDLNGFLVGKIKK